MTSLYAAIAPHFTQDLLTPELKVGFHDEGGSWPFVAASLSQRLPLRGIEWKNLVGVTKSIDRLPITFVAQSELDALPLVCIYLVKCEDLEHYRASAKARLAAWVERMNAAKVEWMVLYVPLGTRARASGSRSTAANNSVYKKIFDKIRSDFAHRRPSASSSMGMSMSGSGGASTGGSGGGGSSGSGGASTSALSERICKIEILEGNSIVGGAPGQHQQHDAQWSELLLRLRHCIMDAFQIKCYQYEEEVRVLDAKRTSNAAGWDFGAFFLAKERLALMYQQTYLLDDAIRHFDELDAIFLNLSASEKRFFQGDAAKRSFRADDAIFTVAPLALDLSATQQAIAANRASAHVVQLHCFCRQLRALYLMGSFPQLIERATAFIASFFESLAQLSDATNSGDSAAITRHQPYQWAVGACLEVAYACELSWNGHDYQVSSASVPAQAAQAIAPEIMARHLGDILYLARRLLTRFAKACASADAGAQRSLPPTLSPSASASALLEDPLDVDADAGAAHPRAWYEWLERMFAAQRVGERYERCVWEMSHLASLQYSRAGRHRFAVFLGGECARYHLRHREFESASRLFRSHARQCEEDKWWNIVGACARSICGAELALGRAAEAVAACFSLLAITQDARSEIGREDLDAMMRALVQSLDQNDSAARLRMGELIKPTLSIETMQSAGSDLDYGQVRVALCIANGFPAGIHIEKLRVRFAKLRQPRHACQQDDGSDDSDDDAAAALPAKRSEATAATTSSTATELPHFHSLVLGDAAPLEHEQDSSDGDAFETERVTQQADSLFTSVSTSQQLLDAHINDSGVLDGESPLDGSAPQDAVNAFEELLIDTNDVFVLEERNVYLYEHASVDLVFLHSGLAVGAYVCSGIDCVVAGNTFSLLAGSALADTQQQQEKQASSIKFEIPRRESTLCVTVQGPPVLTPQSIEQLCVVISAQSDTVADGVLELTTDSSSAGDEALGEPLLRFLRAELQTSVSPPPTPSKPRSAVCSNGVGVDSVEHALGSGGRDKLLLSIPSLAPRETLVYRVWLCVGDADELAVSDVPIATVSATLRYQHVAASETSVALRRADAAFQVLRPLDERVRLQRVDTRIVVAVALTCNNACGLVMRDYRLTLHSHGSSSGETHALTGPTGSSSHNSSSVVIAHDPNARLRNASLRPGETLHLAFTLLDRSSRDDSGGSGDSADAFPDEVHLVLNLQYDAIVLDAADRLAAAGDDGDDDECAVSILQPQLDMQWASSLLVRIPLANVCGPHYRIDVAPHVAGRDVLRQPAAFEFAVGDEVAFRVTVWAAGGSASRPPALSMLLCLDARSERDWILLGKPRERFTLVESIASDDDNANTSSAAGFSFSTHKRFIATRVGRLRFPSFHLRDGGSHVEQPAEAYGEDNEAEACVPSERVLFPQRTMQILVT